MLMELPLGFGMALAQNEAAMKRFEALSEAEKQEILEQTHHVKSKQEMRQLMPVSAIPAGRRLDGLCPAHFIFFAMLVHDAVIVR